MAGAVMGILRNALRPTRRRFCESLTNSRTSLSYPQDIMVPPRDLPKPQPVLTMVGITQGSFTSGMESIESKGSSQGRIGP